MKKLLKYLFASMAGLIATMLIVAVLVSMVGTWAHGGTEQWMAALKSAAPYLLIWRIIVYAIAAGFWYSAYRMYEARGDTLAVGRMKRIGGFFLLLILFLEVPKYL
ncbi:MAG: hypothetical protein LBE75_05195 [Burkholderiales bacterium]|nr:hypothetical protein [Burkholderiales bacterium]